MLSMWYKRTEAQKRFTFFFSSTTLAGAFGGLLASAIGKMDGLREYSGWRWSKSPLILRNLQTVFILEGVATCLLSLIGFFVIADFPEEAKFLTEPEREFVIAKLEKDIGNSAYEYLSWRRVFSVFKDWKIWVGGFMYLGMIVGAYGNCMFLKLYLTMGRICVFQSDYHCTIGIYFNSCEFVVDTPMGSSFRFRNDSSCLLRLPSSSIPFRPSMYHYCNDWIYCSCRTGIKHASLLRVPLPRCTRRVHSNAHHRVLVQHKPRRSSQTVCR